MRIILITPKLTGGGAERVTARLANTLCADHEVAVYCMYPREGGYALDSRVLRIDYKRTSGARRSSPRDEDRILQLRDVKRELGVDCAISLLRGCNYFNVKSRLSEHVVASVRCMCAFDEYPDARSRAWGRHMVRHAARRADELVCVSQRVADEQIRSFKARADRTHVIYNPVDAAELYALAAEEAEDPGFRAFRAVHEFCYITSGRLVEQKGQRQAIQALASVRSSVNAGLVILGTGPLEDALVRQAEASNVSKHVYFAGFTATPFAYYGACDAFVFPSLFEGFPNALLEALACGLPVVSADSVSGPRELLAPETDYRLKACGVEQVSCGLLVPLRACPESPHGICADADALAQAMRALAQDAALRSALSEAGRRRANDFAPDAIAKQWIEVMSREC